MSNICKSRHPYEAGCLLEVVRPLRCFRLPEEPASGAAEAASPRHAQDERQWALSQQAETEHAIAQLVHEAGSASDEKAEADDPQGTVSLLELR